MFCGKCGSEYKEGAKFCPQCGNSLESITSADNEEVSRPAPEQVIDFGQDIHSPNKRRIALIIIIVAVIAIVIVIIAISVTRHSSTKTTLSIEDQMNLGIKYLEEENYEEAVEELMAVIAVDPNMQTYRYLADAYLGLDEIELAGEVYKDAVEFALDTYEQTGGLPDGTEELYEDILAYESDRVEEVPKTDKLKDLITPVISEAEEDDDEVAVIKQEVKDDAVENGEQTDAETGVNTAYIDENGIVTLNITTYDESYFRDNDLHLKRLEPNSDEVYDFGLKTYGTFDTLNDLRVSVYTTIQIDVIEDEEEGYVDSIFTVKRSNMRILDLLEPQENYSDYLYVGMHLPSDEGIACDTSYVFNAYDFYTGCNLFTKKDVVIESTTETTETDLSPVKMAVKLPDGTTGFITATIVTESENDWIDVTRIIIKHPRSYDGIVFAFDGGYKLDKDERDRRNNEAEIAVTNPTFYYAKKTNNNVGYQDNMDYYGASKTAEELSLN